MSRQNHRRAVCSLRAPVSCEAALHGTRPTGRKLRVELLEDRRLLAVIPVTNLFDYGSGSLRQAIISANNMVGPDTIDLTGVSGTIPVALGEMEIIEAVTIEGPGADQLTIDAQQNSRIFNINTSLGDFTISGLTLTGGSTTGDGLDASDDTFRGGAIRSLTTGTLTIDASIVTDNHTEGDYADGGAIHSFSQLTITNSTISGNSTAGLGSDGGAAQVLYGNFSLTQSTIRGNSTAGVNAEGGGVFTAGYASVIESTISGNGTLGGSSEGGGIYLRTGSIVLTASTISNNQTAGDNSAGGGIGSSTLDDVDVTIIQSTISGNQTFGSGSSGGGVFATGDLSVDQSTITQNRAIYGNATAGGVWNGDSGISIADSVVADNTAGGGSPDIDPGTGTFDVNYSLIGVDPGGIVGMGNLTGNLPTLGPLTFNGGPTQTHALLPGSLGIDVGDPSIAFNPAEFDQRGMPFTRVVDGGVNGLRIDMGAFERQSLTGTLVIDTTVDESDGDFSVGDLSLREAIELANGTAVDTLEFDPTVFGTPQTILLELGEIQIGEAVTINGPGSALLTVDAQQNSRIFNIVAETGDVTLRGMTITGGRVTDDGLFMGGGAIRSVTDGTLTVEQSVLAGNRSEGDSAQGGAIFARPTTVTINQTILTGNSTTGSSANGGAIYASIGAVTLTDSTLSDNSTGGTSGRGGGIDTFTGTITLTRSTISGNTTENGGGRGGGIHTFGPVVLTESTLSGNSTLGSNASGGGVYSTDTITLTRSTLSGNSTAGYLSRGGGIFSRNPVTITSSTVTGNSTAGNLAEGGGIYLKNTASDPSLTIQNSIVAGNTVGGGSTNPDISHDPDGIFAVDYSFIGDTSGLTGPQIFAIGLGNGNIADDDPLLGPLAYNGGPTETHALLSGSKAIDAGDPSILPNASEFDQRGDPFLRVRQGKQGSSAIIDMGAYERQGIPNPSLVVDTVVDESDGDYSLGDLSLREALGLANGDLGANTITFRSSLAGETISLVLGQLDVTDSVTITGLGADQLVIDAQQGSRVFNIDEGDNTSHQNVIISGLTITGGLIDEDGGGIRALENLELIDSVVSGNASAGVGINIDGGGLYLRMFGGMTSTISGTTIADNSVQGGGGGLRAVTTATDTLDIDSSTVSGNSATLVGGGLRITGGATTNISHSTIAFNTADSDMSGFGGVGGISASTGVTLYHTIVGSNIDTTGPENDLDGTFTANYSLIGNTSGATINGSDNIENMDPRLAPLGDNGGPTPTHSLLPISPALDSGDIGIPSPPTFDQRGPGFARIVGIRIDRGALEVQPPSADFNFDGFVSGIDFLLWQIGFGTPMPLATKADGDADNDTDSDNDDLDIWELQYGGPAPVVAAFSAPLSADSSAPQSTAGQELPYDDPTPLAASFSAPLLAVSSASQGVAAEPLTPGQLADLALTVELARDSTDQQEPLLEDQSVFVDDTTKSEHMHEPVVPQALARSVDDLLGESSCEVSEPESPWLTDELLERVFGQESARRQASSRQRSSAP